MSTISGHTSTLVMRLVSFHAQQDLVMREKDEGNKPLNHQSSHDFTLHGGDELPSLSILGLFRVGRRMDYRQQIFEL